MDPAHVVVTSTTDSEQAATELAAGVIERGLGGCAQVLGPVTSVFRWEGAVQTEQEWRVEIKAATSALPALTAHLVERHGYDLPEIIATPITGGSVDYLAWLSEQTR